MKLYLPTLLISLLFLKTASGQDMTADFFIGKWVSIDSTSGTIMSHHFVDKEHVTIAFQNERHDSKYRLDKHDGLTVMTFTNEEITSKFVIVPRGENAFLMYLPKEYERMLQASKAAPGTITWGWSTPKGIELKRQVAK